MLELLTKMRRPLKDPCLLSGARNYNIMVTGFTDLLNKWLRFSLFESELGCPNLQVWHCLGAETCFVQKCSVCGTQTTPVWTSSWFVMLVGWENGVLQKRSRMQGRSVDPRCLWLLFLSHMTLQCLTWSQNLSTNLTYTKRNRFKMTCLNKSRLKFSYECHETQFASQTLFQKISWRICHPHIRVALIYSYLIF